MFVPSPPVVLPVLFVFVEFVEFVAFEPVIFAACWNLNPNFLFNL
jgi:hypothetical protein